MYILLIQIQMYIIQKIDFVLNCLQFCNSTINCSLGPAHTYRDIFESATFSFRIKKFPRPHVAYSNRIRMSILIHDGIRIHCSTHFSSAIKCVQRLRLKARDSGGKFALLLLFLLNLINSVPLNVYNAHVYAN